MNKFTPTHKAGEKFGRLTIEKYGDKGRYYCVCDCGNVKLVRTGNLTAGKTKSCGCLASETKFDFIMNGTKHGGYKTRSYKSYMQAKRRCLDPNCKDYPAYGGRGIKFCYTSFQEWFADLGERPMGDYSVDRIDPDGNYEKGNCRWLTAKYNRSLARRNK